MSRPLSLLGYETSWMPASDVAGAARSTRAKNEARAVDIGMAGFLRPPSLVAKQLTLDEFVDERAHAVLAGAGSLHQPVDDGAVAEADGHPGRGHHELLQEVARHLPLLALEQTLERANVGEGPPVRQLA